MITYCRQIFKVKCNSCGDIQDDVDAETMVSKEISKGQFELEMKMDCKCGGVFDYIEPYKNKIDISKL